MTLQGPILDISCILPTHARPRELRAALDSVASQTTNPLEVLVVLDVDDPQTENVVDDFAQHGFPIKLLTNQAQPGASGSRNLGAACAAGEVLAFLDDDDVWAPSYLATAVAHLQSEDVDMVVTGIRRVRPDGGVQRMVMSAQVEPPKWFDRNPGLTGSNVLLRKAIFDRVGGFDPALPVMNDWDFLVRVLACGARYAVVDDLLVEWRDHDGDRISTPTERRAKGIEAFAAKHRNAMSDHQYAALSGQALGIRRRRSRNPLRRLYYSIKLLCLIGPTEAVRRRIGHYLNIRWRGAE